MSDLNHSLAVDSTDTNVFRRHGIARKRILVVESDGFTRLVLIYLFRIVGMAVDFTANGTLALSTLRRSPPDALLLELKPHGLSGLDLIKSARRDSRFRDHPVYVFAEEELLHRGTKKELLKNGAKIIDRRCTSMEGLVKRIVEDLMRTTTGSLAEAGTTEEPGRKTLGEEGSGGDFPKTFNGVRWAPESPLKAGDPEELVKKALLAAQKTGSPRVPNMPPVPVFPVAAPSPPASSRSLGSPRPQTMAATAFPSEHLQPAVPGPAAPEHQDESEYLVAAEPAAQEAVDEDKVEIIRPCLPDTQGISDLTAEPIAEARATENEWTIEATGLAMAPLAPEQEDARITTENEQDTLAFQSAALVSEAGEESQLGIQSVQDESAVQHQVSVGQQKDKGSLAQQILKAFDAQERDQAKAQLNDGEAERGESSVRETEEQLQEAASNGRVKELEQALSERALELEHARVELERQTRERERVESEVRGELEKVDNAFKQAEVERGQAEARAVQLEEELSGLRQADAQLNSQLDNEQQAKATLTELVKDLEQDLSQRASELERARVDLQKQAEERERIESDLRGELEKANSALRQAELERNQAEVRSVQLEQELTGLKQSDTELSCRFDNEQQAKTTLTELVKELERKLNEQASESERARVDLAKQVEEQERLESDLRGELEKANSALRQAEFERNQAEVRSVQLEQELTGLKQSDTELSCRFDNEQQAKATLTELVKELEQNLSERESELEHVRAELEMQAKEYTCAEVDLRQELEKTETALRQAELARKQAEARAAHVEHEFTGLLQAEEALNRRFENERQAKATLSVLVKALQQKLSERVSEVESVRGELEGQTRERERVESELRGELEKAGGQLRQAEVAREQAEARSARLEQELTRLQRAVEELQCRFENEKQAKATLTALVAQLEQKLNQGVLELQRTRGELESQAKERERVESELRGELEKAESGLGQAQARCGQLEQESNALRQVHTRLNADLARGQQEAAVLAAQNQELGRQLQQAKELNSHLRKSLASFEAAHQTLKSAQHNLESQSEAVLNSALESEAKLRAEAAERQRLSGELENARRALANDSLKCETLEAEIEQLRQAQRESDSKAEQEAAECRRLREELDAAQRNLRDRSQRDELELGKLQSALQFAQVDSARREMQVVRMRHFLKDSGRSRLVRKTLHREMRDPVDHLQQAARNLVELEMGEEQKKLAQQILQTANALDARLREPKLSQTASAEVAPAAEDGPPSA